MLEKNFTEVYDKFKLQFYRRVFELVRERDGSLSAMEAFSLEVIKMLDEPTVGQFADFLTISHKASSSKRRNPSSRLSSIKNIAVVQSCSPVR